MKRPPRKLDHSPFSISNIGYAVVQGLGMGAILLLGYWILRNAAGISESQGRAIVFIPLVVGILLLVMANRDPEVSLSKGTHKKNVLFLWLTVLVAGMLLAVTAVPVVTSVLQFQLPTLVDWRFAALMVVSMLIWLEALRRTRQTGPGGRFR